MFGFVIRYLGFLKFVPGMAIMFDNWLKVYTFIADPSLLEKIDALKKEVSAWPGITTQIHKYGGLQFNYHGKELGHIHSNGLLDMLLSRAQKHQVMLAGRVNHHHLFTDTGWISFHIHTEDDKIYATGLLRQAYLTKRQKHNDALQ